MKKYPLSLSFLIEITCVTSAEFLHKKRYAIFCSLTQKEVIVIWHQYESHDVNKEFSRLPLYCGVYGGRTTIVFLMSILNVYHGVLVVEFEKIVNETKIIFLIQKNVPFLHTPVVDVIKDSRSKTGSVRHASNTMVVGLP